MISRNVVQFPKFGTAQPSLRGSLFRGRKHDCMKRIRFLAALWCGKLAAWLLRLMKRNGSYAPGKIALKLCPDFLAQIGRPEILIGVTGTNGKTTVSNMLSDLLASFGETVVSNRLGSNIDAGAASALIAEANLSGRCRRRIGVLEMDERSAPRLFPVLKPDYLLVTNLFRDSMRRNAHPEYIASLIESNIPGRTTLILNADDPISSALAPLNTRVTFGMDAMPWEPPVRENIVCDARVCPSCGSKLTYDFRRYHHIGRVHCENCGRRSPTPDFELIHADPGNSRMQILEGTRLEYYRMPSATVHNLYNALSCVALLRTMGYSSEQIAEAMEKLTVVRSRFSEEQIGSRLLTTSMAKGLNAVACSRNFDVVKNAEGRKAVILMLDDVFDEKSSSENIAWLYDADFEFLNDSSVVQVIAVGVRSADTRLRLLLAGVDPARISMIPKEADVAAALRLEECDRVFVLFEVYRQARAMAVREAVAERMRAV